VVTDVTAGGVPAHWLAAPGRTPAGCSCSCTMGAMSLVRCAATASWLRAEQDLPAASMAVAGASAGGGLAAALLVAVRDAGQPRPAAAVLMSPTVDLTSSGASMTERADQDPVSTPALFRQLAADYLAGANPRTPLASPLFASLAGLPPLLIQAGTADILLSDAERLAAATTRAGVHVTVHIGDGLPHVFPIMAGTPEAAEATEQTGDFLRARVR
jgi:epsilon-lactone hydrolase